MEVLPSVWGWHWARTGCKTLSSSLNLTYSTLATPAWVAVTYMPWGRTGHIPWAPMRVGISMCTPISSQSGEAVGTHMPSQSLWGEITPASAAGTCGSFPDFQSWKARGTYQQLGRLQRQLEWNSPSHPWRSPCAPLPLSDAMTSHNVPWAPKKHGTSLAIGTLSSTHCWCYCMLHVRQNLVQ